MNIKDAIESLDYMFRAQLTPFFWGHAGIGKTSIIKQYAKQKGFKFFAFYLGTQSDVGDILGLADFKRDADGSVIATRFAMPEWLRETIDYCEQNPESGAVIFLDEFNRGRRDILAGMFSLALDKSFHTITLPKNCHIVAAGNPPTDEYFTTDVNETALMARFVHIKLEPTFDEWVKYAENCGMNSSLVGFLKQQPELLEQQRTEFALPVKVDRRAWERLNRLFTLNTPANLLENLMAGIIGLDRTVAYQAYMRSADKPATGEDVLSGKALKNVKIWSDPDNTMSSLLNLTCDNVKELLVPYKEELTADERKNLFDFLTTIPKDISYTLIVAFIQSQNPVIKNFWLDKKYEKKLVALVKTAKGTADKDKETEKAG
jgi:hypothetical protein